MSEEDQPSMIVKTNEEAGLSTSSSVSQSLGSQDTASSIIDLDNSDSFRDKIAFSDRVVFDRYRRGHATLASAAGKSMVEHVHTVFDEEDLSMTYTIPDGSLTSYIFREFKDLAIDVSREPKLEENREKILENIDAIEKKAMEITQLFENNVQIPFPSIENVIYYDLEEERVYQYLGYLLIGLPTEIPEANPAVSKGEPGEMKSPLRSQVKKALRIGYGYLLDKLGVDASMLPPLNEKFPDVEVVNNTPYMKVLNRKVEDVSKYFSASGKPAEIGAAKNAFNNFIESYDELTDETFTEYVENSDTLKKANPNQLQMLREQFDILFKFTSFAAQIYEIGEILDTREAYNFVFSTELFTLALWNYGEPRAGIKDRGRNIVTDIEAKKTDPTEVFVDTQLFMRVKQETKAELLKLTKDFGEVDLTLVANPSSLENRPITKAIMSAKAFFLLDRYTFSDDADSYLDRSRRVRSFIDADTGRAVDIISEKMEESDKFEVNELEAFVAGARTIAQSIENSHNEVSKPFYETLLRKARNNDTEVLWEIIEFARSTAGLDRTYLSVATSITNRLSNYIRVREGAMIPMGIFTVEKDDGFSDFGRYILPEWEVEFRKRLHEFGMNAEHFTGYRHLMRRGYFRKPRNWDWANFRGYKSVIGNETYTTPREYLSLAGFKNHKDVLDKMTRYSDYKKEYDEFKKRVEERKEAWEKEMEERKEEAEKEYEDSEEPPVMETSNDPNAWEWTKLTYEEMDTFAEEELALLPEEMTNFASFFREQRQDSELYYHPLDWIIIGMTEGWTRPLLMQCMEKNAFTEAYLAELKRYATTLTPERIEKGLAELNAFLLETFEDFLSRPTDSFNARQYLATGVPDEYKVDFRLLETWIFEYSYLKMKPFANNENLTSAQMKDFRNLVGQVLVEEDPTPKQILDNTFAGIFVEAMRDAYGTLGERIETVKQRLKTKPIDELLTQEVIDLIEEKEELEEQRNTNAMKLRPKIQKAWLRVVRDYLITFGMWNLVDQIEYIASQNETVVIKSTMAITGGAPKQREKILGFLARENGSSPVSPFVPQVDILSWAKSQGVRVLPNLKVFDETIGKNVLGREVFSEIQKFFGEDEEKEEQLEDESLEDVGFEHFPAQPVENPIPTSSDKGLQKNNAEIYSHIYVPENERFRGYKTRDANLKKMREQEEKQKMKEERKNILDEKKKRMKQKALAQDSSEKIVSACSDVEYVTVYNRTGEKAKSQGYDKAKLLGPFKAVKKTALYDKSDEGATFYFWTYPYLEPNAAVVIGQTQKDMDPDARMIPEENKKFFGPEYRILLSRDAKTPPQVKMTKDVKEAIALLKKDAKEIVEDDPPPKKKKDDDESEYSTTTSSMAEPGKSPDSPPKKPDSSGSTSVDIPPAKEVPPGEMSRLLDSDDEEQNIYSADEEESADALEKMPPPLSTPPKKVKKPEVTPPEIVADLSKLRNYIEKGGSLDVYWEGNDLLVLAAPYPNSFTYLVEQDNITDIFTKDTLNKLSEKNFETLAFQIIFSKTMRDDDFISKRNVDRFVDFWRIAYKTYPKIYARVLRTIMLDSKSEEFKLYLKKYHPKIIQ